MQQKRLKFLYFSDILLERQSPIQTLLYSSYHVLWCYVSIDYSSAWMTCASTVKSVVRYFLYKIRDEEKCRWRAGQTLLPKHAKAVSLSIEAIGTITCNIVQYCRGRIRFYFARNNFIEYISICISPRPIWLSEDFFFIQSFPNWTSI